MANPHHRKKHKHFQPPPHHETKQQSKQRGAIVMGVVGGVFGLIISYMGASDSIGWLAFGTAAGAVLGYLFGKRLDKSFEKS